MTSCKSRWEPEPGLCRAWSLCVTCTQGTADGMTGSTLCSHCASAPALAVWPGGGRKHYSDTPPCVSFRAFLCFRIHVELCCQDWACVGMSSHAAKLDQNSCVLTSPAFTHVCHGDSGSVGASLCFAGYSPKNYSGGLVSKGRQFGEEDGMTGFL